MRASLLTCLTLCLRRLIRGVVRCVGVEVEAVPLNEVPRGQPRRLVIRPLTPVIVRAKGSCHAYFELVVVGSLLWLGVWWCLY